MRLIDRYIFREVFSHALLGLLIFTFVLFVPQLVRLMELAVRHAADVPTVLRLVLYVLPGVLTFTVPMAVLVGVLIGLGRMSADSETIALHALGLGLQRILMPVLALAALAMLLTLALSTWLGPAALGQLRQLEDRLRSTQASFEVQPRVFDERFPRFVLYVQDIVAGETHWKGLLLAESGDEGTRLTLAGQAVVIADDAAGKFQLHLENGSTHEYSPAEPRRYSVSTFAQSDLTVPIRTVSRQASSGRPIPERTMGDLRSDPGATPEASVELQRRLALPAACVVFALAGVPVAARPRRGGRAAGFIFTTLLISAYYLLFVTGSGMARRGDVSPFVGTWGANLITAIGALVLIPRAEEIGRAGFFSRLVGHLAAWRRVLHAQGAPRIRSNGSADQATARRLGRALGFPLLLDFYILRSFFSTALLTLLGFLLLFHAFTFFELLNDITHSGVPFVVVAEYFLNLTPHLLYQLLPLAALVSLLMTLGLLSKNNEITAFKAGGTSAYRLAFPLLVAGLMLATAMLLLDQNVLPGANQRQDALRNVIKGRPAQTFFQPRRQWIFGPGGKLYNYRHFDPEQAAFAGLNVFELDPQTFQMRRRVFASRARWSARMGLWVLEDGWVRNFNGSEVSQFTPFAVQTLTELSEPPAYFQREVRQSSQMNWGELGDYIRGLRQAGFDVARLSVQWHRKLAYPVLAPIVMLLGIPFAFLVGTRGALSGIAAALGIAIAYWATAALFEALGGVGQLPPLLAAWAPDLIFTFLGAYLFLRMPT